MQLPVWLPGGSGVQFLSSSPRHMFNSLVLAVASEGAPRLQVCLLHPSEFPPLFAWSRVILEYEINCVLVIAAGLGPYGLVMVKKVF